MFGFELSGNRNKIVDTFYYSNKSDVESITKNYLGVLNVTSWSLMSSWWLICNARMNIFVTRDIGVEISSVPNKQSSVQLSNEWHRERKPQSPLWYKWKAWLNLVVFELVKKFHQITMFNGKFDLQLFSFLSSIRFQCSMYRGSGFYYFTIMTENSDNDIFHAIDPAQILDIFQKIY